MARDKKAVAYLGVAGVVARRSSRQRVDPVQRAMDRAPIDDEPLTEEEERSLEEIEAEGGPRYSLEEARKLLGLA